MKVDNRENPCQVCGHSHWSWTDTHGIARCGKCGDTAYMNEASLPEDKKGMKPPVSTLRDEFLPKFQKWWKDTVGNCTFDEYVGLGERAPTTEEIAAIRRMAFETEVAKIKNMPKILIEERASGDGKPTFGVGLIMNPEGERWSDKCSTAYWALPDTKRCVRYTLAEGVATKEEAGRAAYAAQTAFRVSTGTFNAFDPSIIIVFKERMTLSEWLKSGNTGTGFWACHPMLKTYRIARGTFRAYLYDKFGHGMSTSLGFPDGEGDSEDDAVQNLVDRIRGRSISFSGYHNGAFTVPSDLTVGDWKDCFDLVSPNEKLKELG